MKRSRSPGPKAVVIGSGPIRIGQGIEFDYSCVQAAHALHAANVRSIMLNNNPETVSTDFDTSDRLYIGPLDEEGVMDILYHEGTGYPNPPTPFPRGKGRECGEPCCCRKCRGCCGGRIRGYVALDG